MSLLQRIRGLAGEISLQEDLSLPIPSQKQKTGISQPQTGHQPATQAGPVQKYPTGVHPIIYFLCHRENYTFFLQELPSLPHNSECWTELGDAPIKDSCPAPVPGQDPRFSGPSGAVRTKRPRRAGGGGWPAWAQKVQNSHRLSFLSFLLFVRLLFLSFFFPSW